MESIYANQIFNNMGSNNLGNNIINQIVINQTINITNKLGQEDDEWDFTEYTVCATDEETNNCQHHIKSTDKEKVREAHSERKAGKKKESHSERKAGKERHTARENPPKRQMPRVSKFQKDETTSEQSYHISEQQIKAVKEIIEEFEQRRRWIILTAQMQSGKTTTYYLTATVMLMKRLVDKVIIFSGNTENELKIQINEDKNKLIDHLIRNRSALDTFGNVMNIFELTHYIRENLIVLWGGYDMKKYEGHCSTDRVLYIWDESHAAQNKINMPAKFLKDVEISACGYQDNLEEQNSYMLSVSATPFSEISDNKHEEQTKSIVNLDVDDNLYHGVKKMIEKGLIKSYRHEIWDEHLTRTLNHHKRREPKYALVRLRENRMISGDELVRIITDAGWKYLTFDSSKDSDIANIKTLERQPTMHTVVILKGKCRMGKVVPKQFIAFCMETARKSDTDVILQGLLGRMCGYPKPGNPIHEVEIHLSHHVFVSCDGKTEFERYIKYIQSNDTIPRRAKNILSGDTRKKSTYYPIIPIRIRFNQFPQNIRDKIKTILPKVNRRSNDYTIQNYNNPDQSSELFERFKNKKYEIKIKHVNEENNTYRNIPRIIHESIRTQTPLNLGSSCGIEAENKSIVIWVFEKNYEEFGIHVNDVFIDARTSTTTIETIIRDEENKKMPPTKKEEVFCESDDDEIIEEYVENDTDYESGYDTDRTSLDTDC